MPKIHNIASASDKVFHLFSLPLLVMQRSCGDLPLCRNLRPTLNQGPALAAGLWLILLQVTTAAQNNSGPSTNSASPFCSFCEALLVSEVSLTGIDTCCFINCEIQRVEVIFFYLWLPEKKMCHSLLREQELNSLFQG